MESPITILKGKFTQSEIIDFVGRSKDDRWTKQLLNIILTDIGTLQYKLATGSATDSDAEPIVNVVFDYSEEAEDVYGDYNNDGIEEPDTVVEVEQPVSEVDVDDVSTIITKLIEVFAAK